MSIFERISEFKSAPNDCQLKDVTVDLDDFNNVEIADKLREIYKLKDTLQLKVATFINCVLTHEVKYFMITRRKFEVAIKEDTNHSKNGMNSGEYGRLLSLLRSKGVIKVVEEYSKGDRKAGVYEVIDVGLTSLLDKMHSIEYYEEQRRNTIEYYNKNNKEVIEDETLKDSAAERRKEKNRLLEEAKKIKG